MRMLFLTTGLPSLIGGERLRPLNFLRYFPKDWQIKLLSFAGTEGEKELLKNPFPANISVGTVTLPKYKSYLNCLQGLPSGEPLEVAYYKSSQMHKLVEEELRLVKYDIIFCHLLRMAPYALKYPGPRKVLDLVDALSLRYALSSKFRKGAFKFIEGIESQRLTKYEPWVSGHFDLNLTASSSDKIYLGNLGVKNLAVLENGIDLDWASQPAYGKLDPHKIVFFGNLRAFHNIDAVMYFYKKIFPLVKQKVKKAKFVVMGANIPRCIMKIKKDKSVGIFRDVADIRPLIRDACVSVAPMRIGAGVQNKILQAMALKVPVVTTSLGLGGIQAKPGLDILVADNPFEFADKVIMLMQNQSRESIIENAFRLIKEKYSWTDIVKGLSNKLVLLSQN